MNAKSIVLLMLLTTHCFGNSIAPVHIDSLFAQSSVVCVVEIESGALIKGKGAIYSGLVIDRIKGDSSSNRITFGKYKGLSIGLRYLIFLSKSDDDSLEILQSFVLETTRLNQNIDYIVAHPKPDHVIKIPTERIILPRKIKSFVVDKSNLVWSIDKTDKTRWVRIEELLSYLRKLKRAT